MIVKAGKGYCIINDSKFKIRTSKDLKKPYCMYKGKRYVFNKDIPKDRIITTEVFRDRRSNNYRTRPRNSRRKRRSKRRPRSVFMKRRSKNKKLTKVECKQKLSNKIAENMKEFKNGRYKSRSQAIAVSYSQVKKKYPECKRYFD